MVLIQLCSIALILLISLSSSNFFKVFSYQFSWLIGDVRAESKHHHGYINLTPNNHQPYYNSNTRHSHQSIHSLRICCAWSSQLTNGQLTYKIIGGTKAERQAVTSAANAWMKNINGLNFVQIPNNNAADIVVGFQSGAEQNTADGIGTTSTFGDTVGQTSTYFDPSGFIAHAKVTIATAAFGNKIASSQLKQIAMHELGHTLGLGHANFNGDLMSPVINPSTAGISKCDVNGVLHAEQWLAGPDTNTISGQPREDHLNC